MFRYWPHKNTYRGPPACLPVPTTRATRNKIDNSGESINNATRLRKDCVNTANWTVVQAVPFPRVTSFLTERSGSGVAMLKPWAIVFTLHCSRTLRCINEYLAIDSGGYVYEQPSCINCSIWLYVSQRSRDGV